MEEKLKGAEKDRTGWKVREERGRKEEREREEE